MTDFAGTSDAAFALIVQPDGKLVAAGSTAADGGTTDFALARYSPDGHLDETFGNGGKVTTPGGVARALVLQADGKLIAAGGGALVRYNGDGSVDSTFADNGTLRTTIFGEDGPTGLVPCNLMGSCLPWAALLRGTIRTASSMWHSATAGR